MKVDKLQSIIRCKSKAEEFSRHFKPLDKAHTSTIRSSWNAICNYALVLALLPLLVACSFDMASDSRSSSPATTMDAPGERPTDVLVRAASEGSQEVRLVDISDQVGIDFTHHYDGHGNFYIVEPIASGMGTLDYDRDGRVDLYFLNGAPVKSADSELVGSDDTRHASEPDLAAAAQSIHEPNRIYRNLGEWLFVDTTAASCLGDLGYGLGVAVADYDNDGFEDVFVNNFGSNVLYRNMGDGTFCDLSVALQKDARERCGAGVCFLDIDSDGNLDLYVGNYVQDPIVKNVQRTTDGHQSYPGPLDFEGEQDQLFRNNGDGTFSDVTEVSGVGQYFTTTMGILATDYDLDGDLDILVVNDVERNLLLENDGDGKFSDVGIERGVAFSYDARRNGNMGVDAGDFNNDGFKDYFTTTFQGDSPVLYRNTGRGGFEDVSIATGAGQGMVPHVNWGVVFVDIENDGDLDAFIGNGHTDINVSKWSSNTAWKVANVLLQNDGAGRFSDISSEAGSGLESVQSTRGVIAEDLDNDGRRDLVMLNSLAKPTVLRNASSARHHWLQLELIGTTAPRDGTGARVELHLDSGKRIAEVYSGRGYQSSFGKRVHFGLGKVKSVPMLKVIWPDGLQQTFRSVQADQVVRIRQAVGDE